jgi:hypothetical protein
MLPTIISVVATNYSHRYRTTGSIRHFRQTMKSIHGSYQREQWANNDARHWRSKIKKIMSVQYSSTIMRWRSLYSACRGHSLICPSVNSHHQRNQAHIGEMLLRYQEHKEKNACQIILRGYKWRKRITMRISQLAGLSNAGHVITHSVETRTGHITHSVETTVHIITHSAETRTGHITPSVETRTGHIITHSVETRTNTRWPVMWRFTRWVMRRYLECASCPPLLH